ncbi:MAG: hypothetical protein SOT37_05360 [Oscillospiraceae bacterium]|nr:hypothetical protein [Oscillospiraceae bacterium]
MTNQEISLEITKILKPDIDQYTRHHNDGDRFETRKRVYAETYLDFLNNSTRTTKPKAKQRRRIKSRVFIKQLQSRQECLPGLFLRISKPHDAINGAEDWI